MEVDHTETSVDSCNGTSRNDIDSLSDDHQRLKAIRQTRQKEYIVDANVVETSTRSILKDLRKSLSKKTCCDLRPRQRWLNVDGYLVSSLSVRESQRSTTTSDLVLDLLVVLILTSHSVQFSFILDEDASSSNLDGSVDLVAYALLELFISTFPVFRRWNDIQWYLNVWDDESSIFRVYFGYNIICFLLIGFGANYCTDIPCKAVCSITIAGYMFLDLGILFMTIISNWMYLRKKGWKEKREAFKHIIYEGITLRILPCLFWGLIILEFPQQCRKLDTIVSFTTFRTLAAVYDTLNFYVFTYLKLTKCFQSRCGNMPLVSQSLTGQTRGKVFLLSLYPIDLRLLTSRYQKIVVIALSTIVNAVAGGVNNQIFNVNDIDTTAFLIFATTSLIVVGWLLVSIKVVCLDMQERKFQSLTISSSISTRKKSMRSKEEQLATKQRRALEGVGYVPWTPHRHAMLRSNVHGLLWIFLYGPMVFFILIIGHTLGRYYAVGWKYAQRERYLFSGSVAACVILSVLQDGVSWVRCSSFSCKKFYSENQDHHQSTKLTPRGRVPKILRYLLSILCALSMLFAPMIAAGAHPLESNATNEPAPNTGLFESCYMSSTANCKRDKTALVTVCILLLFCIIIEYAGRSPSQKEFHRCRVAQEMFFREVRPHLANKDSDRIEVRKAADVTDSSEYQNSTLTASEIFDLDNELYSISTAGNVNVCLDVNESNATADGNPRFYTLLA